MNHSQKTWRNVCIVIGSGSRGQLFADGTAAAGLAGEEEVAGGVVVDGPGSEPVVEQLLPVRKGAGFLLASDCSTLGKCQHI